MEKFIWLSYDLGIKGDYQGIYSWLDDHGAKECGDSVAALSFSYEGGDFFEALKADLEADVSLDRHSRIYVVRQENGKLKGRFLFGKRQRAPWTGYGTYLEQDEDED
ncbi:MAG: hypothetical protein F4X63_04750 [Nitrospira sp. SB0662_bin_26]|nr:hypothetical protein [Nitrospira sp. SB0662_bin_26]